MFSLIEIIILVLVALILSAYCNAKLTTPAFVLIMIILSLLLILTINYQIKDLLEVLNANTKYK